MHYSREDYYFVVSYKVSAIFLFKKSSTLSKLFTIERSLHNQYSYIWLSLISSATQSENTRIAGERKR